MGKNSRKGGDRLEETLRGRIRELEKELRKKDRLIRSLEKQPSKPVDKPKVKEDRDGDGNCPSCGKGKLETISFPRRGTTPLLVISCNLCKYRVKRNEGR